MPRKKKEAPAEGPQQCTAAGCTLPALPGEKLCAPHYLVDAAVDRAKRAFKKDNLAGGIGSALTAILLNAAGPAADRLVREVKIPYAGSGVPRQPRRTPIEDAFRTLGIDPKKATVEDVRRMQRNLAAIYHGDKADPAVAVSKMTEVNEAARICLEHLKA